MEVPVPIMFIRGTYPVCNKKKDWGISIETLRKESQGSFEYLFMNFSIAAIHIIISMCLIMVIVWSKIIGNEEEKKVTGFYN